MKYISSIFSTGAVRKTPKKIIGRILSEVTGKKQHRIIEFGAGQGEISFPLVHEKYADGARDLAYYAFEIDSKFSAALHEELPQVSVISQDALKFKEFIPADFQADYIICSMPLSFYPKQKIRAFIEDQSRHLAANGKIIILFHAFWLIPFLKKQLTGASIHGFWTLPPYFLLVYHK